LTQDLNRMMNDTINKPSRAMANTLNFLFILRG
jgi:hypothetical protein